VNIANFVWLAWLRHRAWCSYLRCSTLEWSASPNTSGAFVKRHNAWIHATPMLRYMTRCCSQFSKSLSFFGIALGFYLPSANDGWPRPGIIIGNAKQ